MKTLISLAALLSTALSCSHAASAHWRFEATPGFTVDSGAGGITLSTPPGQTAPAPNILPSSGPGSNFPETVLSQPNTQAALFSGTGNFSATNGLFTAPAAFTLEAFIHQTTRADASAYIASNWSFNSGTQRSWGMGIAGDAPPNGTVPRELFMILSPNGAETAIVSSGLIVETSQDLFVGASYSSGKVTFFLKKTADDANLIVSETSHTVNALFASGAPFLIGAYDNGLNRFTGLIDEVRFSDSTLPLNQLIATGTPTTPPPILTSPLSQPEPATVSFAPPGEGVVIRYTLNGSDPTPTSNAYTTQLTLSESTTVKAQAFHPNLAPSDLVTATVTVGGFPYIGPIRPRTAMEISGSNWSVGAETLDRDYAVYANYKDYLGPLGVKSVRLQSGWAKTEKVAGTYDWAWLDEVVLDATSQGVTPWMNVSYGNTVYPGGGGANLGAGIPVSAEAKTAWNAWLAAMVLRYKDYIHEWEIWNEPNLNGSVSASAYAELFIRSAEIIRAIQPEAKLIAIAFAGIDTNYANTFLTTLRDQGKLGLVDEISYHAYTQIPENHYGQVQSIRNTIANYPAAAHVTIRQGENGAPSEKGGFGALSGFNWTEKTQAKWDLRRTLGDLGRDIPSSVFTLMDLHYTGNINDKGLLRSNPDMTVSHRKEAYFAIRNLTAVFDNRVNRLTNFTPTHNGGGNLNIFGYTRTDISKPIITLWFGGSVANDTDTFTDVNLSVPFTGFSDPVIADLRTGAVRSIPSDLWSENAGTTNFTTIPVTDSPLVIADRKAIHSPYDLWVIKNFTDDEATDLSITAPSEIFKGTETTNSIAFATDLTLPTAQPDGNSFSYGFSRQDPAPVDYTVESSNDLGSQDPWKPIAILSKGSTTWETFESGLEVSETPLTSTTRSVMVTLPPIPTTRFLRLRVSQP